MSCAVSLGVCPCGNKRSCLFDDVGAGLEAQNDARLCPRIHLQAALELRPGVQCRYLLHIELRQQKLQTAVFLRNVLISTLIVCDLVGFVLCLVFGFLDVPTLFSATGPIGAGLTGMLNVICFSFFMFALLEMLKRSGVFDMLLEKLNNASKTPRQAELVTILLSVIGSVAIGAASISILFVGPVVRKLLQTHNIERTRGSNLMDGIATGLAGIVPYNPVGLNAVSLAIASGVVSESFSFLDYVPYNFHSWLLILLFLLSAITGIGRHFEKGTAAAPETPAAEEK